jgi:hypothetical protein
MHNCKVITLSYDFSANIGIVIADPVDCMSKEELIELFEKLDMGVMEIRTAPKTGEGTIHRLMGGQWRSFSYDPREDMPDAS